MKTLPIIEVIEPPQATALVALAAVKSRLGITGSTEDALLGSLIVEVSAAFDTFLNRRLARRRYEVSFTGDGELYLILPDVPVERGRVTATINGDAVTDFYLENQEIGRLYRPDGWDEDDEPNVVVDFYGGFLCPDAVADWQTATVQASGSWVRPSAESAFRFEATTGGTTGSPEPTWPTAIGETVTDGSVVWTARAVTELPADLSGLALIAVRDLYNSRDGDSATESWAAGPFRESYAAGAPPGVGLHPSIRRGLSPYRHVPA